MFWRSTRSLHRRILAYPATCSTCSLSSPPDLCSSEQNWCLQLNDSSHRCPKKSIRLPPRRFFLLRDGELSEFSALELRFPVDSRKREKEGCLKMRERGSLLVGRTKNGQAHEKQVMQPAVQNPKGLCPRAETPLWDCPQHQNLHLMEWEPC